MDEIQQINELNKQLDKLKHGTITELRDEDELPTFGEHMTREIKVEVEEYLIPDVVTIVETYLDWFHLDSVPLFSVPLYKIQNENGCIITRNIIFFGRTDETEFTMWFDSLGETISGHFPLMLNPEFQPDIDVDDEPDQKYLIGIMTHISHPMYPNIDQFVFSWRKDNTKIIIHGVGLSTKFLRLFRIPLYQITKHKLCLVNPRYEFGDDEF